MEEKVKDRRKTFVIVIKGKTTMIILRELFAIESSKNVS